MSAETITDDDTAEALVDAWVKHWTREGRLDGGLDKVARADLVKRVNAAMSRTETKPAKAGGRKAKAEANG